MGEKTIAPKRQFSIIVVLALIVNGWKLNKAGNLQGG
jgi:hypothetical protein